jgi:hypothetical protein
MPRPSSRRRLRGGMKKKGTRKNIRDPNAMNINDNMTYNMNINMNSAPTAVNVHKNTLIELVDDFILKHSGANNSNADEEYKSIIRKIRRSSRRGDMPKLLKGLEKLSAYYFPDDPYMIPYLFIRDARIAVAEMKSSANKANIDKQIDDLAVLITGVKI